MLLVNHATFAVNSVCHMFGSRRFETKDESRNNAAIALLTGGEGNHNNHHANAKAAYHGLTWREYDLTGYVIRALAAVGLVWDVHQPTEDEIAAGSANSPARRPRPTARRRPGRRQSWTDPTPCPAATAAYRCRVVATTRGRPHHRGRRLAALVRDQHPPRRRDHPPVWGQPRDW
jgi:hypothetical protein